jgi:hypothetical protein
MTLDERRWQPKLARKHKARANREPLPRRSATPSPAQAAQPPADPMRQLDPASPMTRDVERQTQSSRLRTWLRDRRQRR